MGSMLGELPAGTTLVGVYIIYSADITGPEQAIEEMGPAYHLTAGYKDGHRRVGEIIAARFTQTEGDDQYDFGYLGGKGREHYYPAGYTDKEGTQPADDGVIMELPDESLIGQGRHRKWVAALNWAQWLVFADRYLIDLDERGLPVSYEDTMGSITEHGLLDAVAIGNREGWGCQRYGSSYVIDSQFYVSFTLAGEPGEDLKR